MNINIYSEYKVTHVCKGTRIDSENSEPNNIVFKDFETQNEEIQNGYYLAGIIGMALKEFCFCNVNIINNTISIEHFNDNTGEHYVNTWIIEGIE